MNEDLERVRAHYADAVPGDMFSRGVYQLVQDRLGIRPGGILSAHSFCSDEINAIQFPKEAQASIGPFQLGGLDGFPFAGLTGLSAFAHHRMEGGALAVSYGPHIGVNRAGELGFVNRIGQDHASTCCGAASAALDKLARGAIRQGEFSELDYQQNVLEQIVLKARERILTAQAPIREATEVIYEASHARMEELLARVPLQAEQTLRIGVVVINAATLYCAPRHFRARRPDGTEIDLLPEARDAFDILCRSAD